MAPHLSIPFRDRQDRPRSARSVEQEALRRLGRSGDLGPRDVECRVCEGSLRLRGALPRYYLKQVAQAVVVELEGVDDIVNQIQVIDSASLSGAGGDRPARAARAGA